MKQAMVMTACNYNYNSWQATNANGQVHEPTRVNCIWIHLEPINKLTASLLVASMATVPELEIRKVQMKQSAAVKVPQGAVFRENLPRFVTGSEV